MTSAKRTSRQNRAKSTVGYDKESPEPGESSPGGADEVSGSGGEDGCSLRIDQMIRTVR